MKFQLKTCAVQEPSQGYKGEPSYGVTKDRYTDTIKVNDLETPSTYIHILYDRSKTACQCGKCSMELI